MQWHWTGQLLLLHVAGILCWHTCTVKDIERCMKPLQQFTEQTIFPTYTDIQLEHVCGSFKEMQECLDPIKPACTQAEVSVYEGLEKACQFLCKEGYHQYRSHRVCFAKSALGIEGGHCNSTYARQMEYAFDTRHPMHNRRKVVCDETQDFIRCVRTAVAKHCGKEAASWVNNINIRVYHPYMEQVGCQANVSRIPFAIIIGAASAVIFLTLIVVLVIVYHRKRRQSAQLSMNRLNTSSTGYKKTPTDLLGTSPCKSNVYGTSPRRRGPVAMERSQEEREPDTEAVKLLKSCADDLSSRQDEDINKGALLNGGDSAIYSNLRRYNCTDASDENSRNNEVEKQRETTGSIQSNEDGDVKVPLREVTQSSTTEVPSEKGHYPMCAERNSQDLGRENTAPCGPRLPPDVVPDSPRDYSESNIHDCPAAHDSNIYEEEIERLLEPEVPTSREDSMTKAGDDLDVIAHEPYSQTI